MEDFFKDIALMFAGGIITIGIIFGFSAWNPKLILRIFG